MRHKGIEVVGFNQGGRVVCNSFNGPIPATDMFGEEQIIEFQKKLYTDDEDEPEVYASYKGSIISDIHIAMYYFGRDDFDNWAGIPFYGYGDKIIDWAMGKMPQYIGSNQRHDFGFYCNEDAMFHPAKGLLALKISGIEGVKMKNIRIENLQDETPIGSNLCGEITKPQHGLYHFAQQLPYQIGYSMNMVMGITIDFSQVDMEDTQINNLYSSTGLVYGMAAWFESDIDVNGKLHVNNLNAGVDLDDTFDYDDLPNKAAEACSIRLFDDDSYSLSMNWNEDNGLESLQTCINGQIGCLGIDDEYTHFDEIALLNTEDNMECSKTAPFQFAPKTFDELLHSESSLIPGPKAPPPPIDKGHALPSMKNNYMSKDKNFITGLAFIAVLIVVIFIIKMMFVAAKRSYKNDQQSINPTELTYLMDQATQYH